MKKKKFFHDFTSWQLNKASDWADIAEDDKFFAAHGAKLRVGKITPGRSLLPGKKLRLLRRKLAEDLPAEVYLFFL